MYHNLMMKNQTIFTKLVFEKLTEENLSIGQPKILEYLSSHDGAIQKEIAEACNIEPATLTSLLSRIKTGGKDIQLLSFFFPLAGNFYQIHHYRNYSMYIQYFQ